ncbi:hypothetical protein PROFUN_06868 [Planoprotostelium fungivorum]|uniref:Uncharacterized protein n=1 Tax=Planoprotostelium fungivorum TaxID=1890364 RepID=A0A2P6NNG8_9EUKA|nr:hypothetical protein PROFUN_06868 [Planoprotostelium fungivorum]
MAPTKTAGLKTLSTSQSALQTVTTSEVLGPRAPVLTEQKETEFNYVQESGNAPRKVPENRRLKRATPFEFDAAMPLENKFNSFTKKTSESNRSRRVISRVPSNKNGRQQ